MNKRALHLTLDSETTPLKFDVSIFVLEPHPFNEKILLTADYNGFVTIFNIE